MPRFLLLCLTLSIQIGSIWAQCADPEACNYTPESSDSTEASVCLILDPIAVHTEGSLSGLTTYRLYVYLSEPDHFLSAISTVIDDSLDPETHPGQTSTIRIATSTTFYQDPLGSATSSGISPALLDFIPELLYDSWVTIGHAPENGTASATVSTIASPSQNWVANFEAGQNLVMDDIIGGLWYIYNDGNDQGVPDENGKVLIAQITTDGEVEVELSGQYFPDFGTGVNGEADGTSDIQFISALGPECPNNPNSDCTYSGPELDCDGNCFIDVDEDGICDANDSCIGSLDICGICNGPGDVYACGCDAIPDGDCDCNGNQLDALGICGGLCSADLDNDDVCDDIDPCIGTFDACGECNGPGAIYDCGCTGIPNGDCDCNGNQLDALGICGGSCPSDNDQDGLCDDTDPCVGSYDALDVCNGNCASDLDNDNICDDTDPCIGTYDALGECNGNCPADVDGDGVCDNAEIPGCTNNSACNFNANATDDDGTCASDDAIGECGGHCLSDNDEDGICDDIDPCVGNLDACGICNGPGDVYDCGCTGIPNGDCDCNGNQTDIIGDCGGNCVADEDGDGICDDIDSCVGSLDDCGICNGPGAAFECGCNGVSDGECDCNGNQLDALGICGGSCSADIDQDGICDDIDPCVGALDACGVCNGVGDIFQCGCNNIPEGDCDCNGNQLDALGICDGTCAVDLDQDGICDDIDPCVGALDVCGVCEGVGDIFQCGCNNIPEGDCDCNGQQLDILGICGGTCTADTDQDGICDNIDPCVGALDACGVCNGVGEAFQCGCNNIPEGDCDCNGNQPDAIGVCGGTCTADLDQDGICDTIDACIGTFDACGVCNGPGALFDCGCAGIPDGDCDCSGNQADALGICGGSCTSDENNNGICDNLDNPGCTYSESDNFNPAATYDDGSCTFPDPCDENNCPYDINNDGNVGIVDLLDLLVYFGDYCLE